MFEFWMHSQAATQHILQSSAWIMLVIWFKFWIKAIVSPGTWNSNVSLSIDVGNIHSN